MNGKLGIIKIIKRVGAFLAHHHGMRKKSRDKLSKTVRTRGISPIMRAIQEFKIGAKVHIDIDPSIHKGMPHPRFHGKTGEVIGKRGRAFILTVTDGNASKTLITLPEHLSLQQNVGLIYLFNWNNISENNCIGLLKFLSDDCSIYWAKNANIEKIEKDNSIRVSFENKSLSICLNKDKTKAILEGWGCKTYELMVKRKKTELRIFGEINQHKRILIKFEEVLSSVSEAKQPVFVSKLMDATANIAARNKIQG